MSQPINLEKQFTYHSPTDEQKMRYSHLRSEAKALAETILNVSFPSREQSLAIRKLEEAVFWANAAIARE